MRALATDRPSRARGRSQETGLRLEGWLLKKSDFLGQFNARYVRLTHTGSLSWGDSNDLSATPKGSAHLAGAEAVAENVADPDASEPDKLCPNMTVKLLKRGTLVFRAAVTERRGSNRRPSHARAPGSRRVSRTLSLG
jgi:hypothetical protein